MIPYTVIGGYLGAGKTTLLNRILASAVDTRFAIIVNDFGELNIDAGLIESQTDTQINLTNGCICCSLTDGFIEALDQLLALEPAPEHIVVEASGVADVANMAQYGHAPGLRLDGVLVLADAETLLVKTHDKYVGKTLCRQLHAADLIILNKVDLVADTELQACRQWLSTEFNDVPVVESARGNVSLEVLLGAHRSGSTTVLAHTDHTAYATWHFRTEQAQTTAAIEEFVAYLPDFVLRAKGTFATERGWQQLQAVGARKEIDVLSSQAPPGVQLVAIGLKANFDMTLLNELAARCFTS